MQIRRAQFDQDREVLEALEAECFEPGAGYINAYAGSQWWMALDDSTPVGYSAAILGTGCNSGIASIPIMGTAPKARGRGLQRRFIRCAERWARSQGAVCLVTYTAYWNLASANNFIRCGYRLYEPETRWGLEDGLYWRRELVH